MSEPLTNIPSTAPSVLKVKLSAVASNLGLPSAAIEGIAKKTSEILNTKGAIERAPGHPAIARMVISDPGKHPHLVLPKKKNSGGLMCDDNCPQYKSAKICSHTFAAAEHHNLLNGFIASYRKVKASPNLTKLATAGMPKGRGHKGNKPPAKRRTPISIETKIDPNPISTSAVDPDFDSGLPRSDYNVQVNPSYLKSLSASLSLTIGSSFVPMLPPIMDCLIPHLHSTVHRCQQHLDPLRLTHRCRQSLHPLHPMAPLIMDPLHLMAALIMGPLHLMYPTLFTLPTNAYSAWTLITLWDRSK